VNFFIAPKLGLVMASVCIDTFEMSSRQFGVLCKPSATYLHADGRMWGGSLGEDMNQQEAVEQTKLRPEIRSSQ